MALLYCCRVKDRVVSPAQGADVKPSCKLLTASTACRTVGSDWDICNTYVVQKKLSKSPERHGAVTFWKK